MENKTLYLVDATSICYRSFFAIKLSNSKGLPTGAVYGFYQTIKKILAQYTPGYVGICFDVGKKTFRHERFKEYKIQRPETPDALKTQIPIVKKMVKLLGLPMIEKEGFEADDVIASLCKKGLSEGFKVVIVSSDKDMYQLLENDKVVTYNPHQEEFVREPDFKEKFGFAPLRIIDFLALTGDAADNIPGAKGIGKVGATKLIQEFGTIENIFDHVDEISGKTRDILTREKDNIFLSKELATLVPDSIEVPWKDLCVREPDYPEIYGMFKDLEFKAFLKDFPPPSLALKITIVEGLPQPFALKSAALCIDATHVYVFDPAKDCVYKETLDKAQELLKDESVKKISFDFKEQLFSHPQLQIAPLYFDVQIAAYVLDSSLADYELATLVTHYLGDFTTEIPQEAFPGYIYKLYALLSSKLEEAGRQVQDLFYNVEMPLVYVLFKMQDDGVSVHAGLLEGLLSEVERELARISKEIYSAAGKEFNINSPQQLSTVLFEDLKIPPVKKTKTGFSTGEEVLQKLAGRHVIATHILTYRELNKLKTTYLVPLITSVKVNEGRLHAHFNQASTATGRLSSSSPNLQSIPVKGKFSASLRRAFVSSFGDKGVLLSADYSQIELRILAHFSKDPALLEAFKNNMDIHRYTAGLLFGVKEDVVIERQRDIAKRVNFGILYGMSSFGLSQELGISPQEAQGFIDEYFLRYPKVKDYIDKVFAEAKEKGYVATILGRKRYLPDFNNANMQLREFAHRQAVNAPIQGSCADLIKVAMVSIFNECREKRLASKMVIQIHDELIVDVPAQELEVVAPLIRRHMETSIPLGVPVKVDVKTGKNWADMEVYR